MVPDFHYFLPGNNKTYDKQPIPFSLHELFLLCFQMPKALLCNILSIYESFSSFILAKALCHRHSVPTPYTTWDGTFIVGKDVSDPSSSPHLTTCFLHIPGTTVSGSSGETRAAAEIRMQIALINLQKE